MAPLTLRQTRPQPGAIQHLSGNPGPADEPGTTASHRAETLLVTPGSLNRSNLFCRARREGLSWRAARRHCRTIQPYCRTVTTSWRLVNPEDSALLVEATMGNINWSAEHVMEHDVQTRPEFRHYTVLMPERGDFGIVVEAGGEPIGVVWALYLGADDPGFGFVDEATPELCLWVHASGRGVGVGRRLLRALQSEARRRGIARVSLSVEADNFAAHLYATEGFVPVQGRAEAGVMIWAS